MSIEKELETRSGNKCELCTSTDNLQVFKVPPTTIISTDKCLLLCSTCIEQIEKPEKVNANHWRCLNDSMWSEVPAAQVMAWRMLNRLRGEGWPADLLDTMYLDVETAVWAKATGEGDGGDDSIKHKDAFGNLIQGGDTVTLIKNLDVKGANFTAKQGTAVRNVRLVNDNAEHIEGKVNGQHIVILTKFVKKSS